MTAEWRRIFSHSLSLGLLEDSPHDSWLLKRIPTGEVLFGPLSFQDASNADSSTVNMGSSVTLPCMSRPTGGVVAGISRVRWAESCALN